MTWARGTARYATNYSGGLELSDEDLMIEEIDAGPSVIPKTVPYTELPQSAGIACCSAARDNDGVGFIAREALVSWRSHAAAPK